MGVPNVRPRAPGGLTLLQRIWKTRRTQTTSSAAEGGSEFTSFVGGGVPQLVLGPVLVAVGMGCFFFWRCVLLGPPVMCRSCPGV